jgi:hypothetical protein
MMINASRLGRKMLKLNLGVQSGDFTRRTEEIHESLNWVANIVAGFAIEHHPYGSQEP